MALISPATYEQMLKDAGGVEFVLGGRTTWGRERRETGRFEGAGGVTTHLQKVRTIVIADGIYSELGADKGIGEQPTVGGSSCEVVDIGAHEDPGMLRVFLSE